jgi:hypothetical protein
MRSPEAGRKALADWRRTAPTEAMFDQFHVHQCPYCELRFVYANEVKDHVLHDHPEHADSFATVEPHELPV